MLQQTRVATVIPYYRAFLRRYPNVKRLAQAPLDEVLEHWSGLGYYARARNLHRAARTIREQGGRLPRTVEDWVRLPGVGLSTAGAIVSLALDIPAVMLDANARRVLSRHQAMDPGNMNLLQRRAAALLPASRGADYTQGLMDLGAQLCTARDPACERCPLESDCRYAASPPNARAQRRSPDVPGRRLWLLVLSHRRRVLLRQRPMQGIWGGLWSPPEFPSRAAACAWLARRGDFPTPVRGAAVVHRLSHLKLDLRPLSVAVPAGCAPGLCGEGRWIDPDAPGVGLPTPVARLLRTPVL